MNSIIERLIGMDVMSDQVIAGDFLIASKAGIRNYAVALTEAATPEVRETLQRHLHQAIMTHERISTYMIEKGWYHPHNINEQLDMDAKAANTAMNLAD